MYLNNKFKVYFKCLNTSVNTFNLFYVYVYINENCVKDRNKANYVYGVPINL